MDVSEMMQHTMERVWGRYGTAPNGSSDSDEQYMESWAVPLDVARNGDDFVIRASLPGVLADDIRVSIEDNVLSIRGQTAQQHQESSDAYLMRERRTGTFYRSLRLPDTVDVDRVEPQYDHGILTITVPKAEEKKARQLEVKVGSAPVI